MVKMLEREEFEKMTQEVFDALQTMGIPPSHMLFGLYQGIPLNKRGTWYGTVPSMPDKISLYKTNLERGVRNDQEIRSRVRHVLIHEIAHYYGMDEEEVRAAGY
jgi:predicted Zn-dependent protease with MMP-like domain